MFATLSRTKRRTSAYTWPAGGGVNGARDGVAGGAILKRDRRLSVAGGRPCAEAQRCQTE